MRPIDIPIALLFAVVGAASSAYLIWLILMPLLRMFRVVTGSSRVQSASSKLRAVDQLVEQRKYAEALKLLRKAVLLKSPSSAREIGLLREHHQNVLSRCLIIAEDVGSRPTNIAEVERLLLERAELQVLLVKAEESYQNLANRRERSGKMMPTWSKSEYETRATKIDAELKRNAQELSDALDRLFAAVGTRGKDDVIYH